jgi:hypothetical protein
MKPTTAKTESKQTDALFVVEIISVFYADQQQFKLPSAPRTPRMKNNG